LPDKIEACLRALAPCFFAVHRPWTENDCVLREELEERGAGALLLAGLIELALGVNHYPNRFLRRFRAENREQGQEHCYDAKHSRLTLKGFVDIAKKQRLPFPPIRIDRAWGPSN
jgi:hypothetical protein